MYRLVIKDFLLSWKILFASIFLGLTVVFLSSNGHVSYIEFIYIFMVNMVTYITFFYSEGKNAKSQSDMIMLSLPISKSIYVKAKYLTIVLYYLICTICILAFMKGMTFVGVKGIVGTIGIETMLVGLGVVMLLYAIYLPLLFRFGYDKIRLFSTFIYMSIIIIPMAFSNVRMQRCIIYITQNTSVVILGFVFISSLIYILSLKISEISFRDL